MKQPKADNQLFIKQKSKPERVIKHHVVNKNGLVKFMLLPLRERQTPYVTLKSPSLNKEKKREKNIIVLPDKNSSFWTLF